jgi:formate hydrogenlyase transcriptional activator
MGLNHSNPSARSGRDGSESPSLSLPMDYSRLIADLSARLVKASDEDLDAEILRGLQETLQPLGIDRGGLLLVDEGSPIVRISHFWYAEGVEQVSDEINLAELFPWSYQQMVTLGNVRIFESIDSFPPEGEVDRQTYLQMGTKSSFGIPLFIGQRVHSLIVAQSQQFECKWPDEYITHVRLLGEVFVSALQRRDANEALSLTKESLDLAAAAANAGLWALDPKTGLIWATDKAREMFGYDPAMELTLERLLMDIHEDDRDLIEMAVDVALFTNREINVEYRMLGAEGKERWMNSWGCVQSVGGVQHRRLMGVTIDVTRHKQTERQLQKQIQEIEQLKEQLERDNIYLQSEVSSKGGRKELSSAGSLGTIMTQAQQVAGTGSTVLIQGETGTGKELVAQTIHRLSKRNNRPMIVVNCASLPAGLVESELFGREKGAFTGALTKQVGRFELANGSTLFLDEIGELPMETQSKLLRALQEGKFERLGSPHTIKTDVRIIAATNRNLMEEVEQGRFRQDLYYRLNVFPIHVPPLRERREDIPGLVWECITEFGGLMGKKIRRISAHDMQALTAHPWPGNVRELRNVIEHAMITSNGDTLELHSTDLRLQGVAEALSLEEVESRHISSVLRLTNGRIKGPEGAAELLGLNPSTLYFRMRKLGISPDRTRGPRDNI